MEMAKRARTAETPTQTSHRLRPYAPHFYPDRSMVELLRHRRTKEPATDRFHLNHRATSRLYTMRLHDPGRSRTDVRGFCAAWHRDADCRGAVWPPRTTADGRLAISERNAVIGGLAQIGSSRWLDSILRVCPLLLLTPALLPFGQLLQTDLALWKLSGRPGLMHHSKHETAIKWLSYSMDVHPCRIYFSRAAR